MRGLVRRGPARSGHRRAVPRRHARVADRRLAQLGIEPIYGTANPLAFMELQDVQELSNFFGRRVSAHQIGITGDVTFDNDF